MSYDDFHLNEDTQSEGQNIQMNGKRSSFFSADKKVCVDVYPYKKCNLLLWKLQAKEGAREKERKKERNFLQKGFTSTRKCYSSGKVQQLFIGTREELS